MVPPPARSRAPLAGLVCGLLAGGAISTLHAGQARPNLVLTSPSSGQVVKGTIQIAAAADAAGLTAIQFRVNGLPHGPRITSGACRLEWDTAARADATYVLSAVGSGAFGDVTAPSVTVRVENLAAALTPEAADITEDSALIRWRTAVPATSRVEFGMTVAYGDMTLASATLRVDHDVRLAGLAPRTTYHFRVHSRTASGVELASADAIFITGAAAEDRPRVVALPARPVSAVDAGRKARERALAMDAARLRGLPYLPGEVVIQFRPGTSAASRQRALLSVRSRPSLDALEWRGDLAWLHDPAQPDARILAEQLSAQPEVLFAEPNYVLRPVSRGARSRLSAAPATRVASSPSHDLVIAVVGAPDAAGGATDWPSARLLISPECAAGGCAVDAAVADIEDATNSGARIISVGLVGPAHSRAARHAILQAVSRGVLVVIAHEPASDDRNRFPVVDATSIAGAISIAAADAGAGVDAEVVTPGGSEAVIRLLLSERSRLAADPAEVEAALTRLFRRDR